MRKIILFLDVLTSNFRDARKLHSCELICHKEDDSINVDRTSQSVVNYLFKRDFSKFLVLTAFVIFLLQMSLQVNAQTSVKTNEVTTISTNSNGPRAVVTSSQQRKVSPLILEINNLTNGDEELTERVIGELYKLKNVLVDRIVSDEEYESLSDKEKAICVKKSELNEILKQLK